MKRFSLWTTKKFFLPLCLLLVAAGGVVTLSRSAGQQALWSRDVVKHTSLEATAQPDEATKARVSAAYGQLPLSFEANLGQTNRQVDFISRGNGYTLFLTAREAVLALRAPTESQTGRVEQHRQEVPTGAVLRLKLVGGKAKPRAAGQEELPGKVNYFIGKDPRRWRTGIPTYAKVNYQDVYDGVDLVYYGNQRQLEYDFVVRPGTDPAIIGLSFEGADKLEVDNRGELVLQVGGDEIRQLKPLIYQEVDGVRQEIAGRYHLKDKYTIGFQVAAYDASRPLVIDPVLVYSTYLGGNGRDNGFGIAVDAAGSAYVTGSTVSTDFPTTSAAFDTTFNGGINDAFVTKLNPSGSALDYSTYLGGSDQDIGKSIAVDASGSAYVMGFTISTDFPTTLGAFDTSHNGSNDVFVTKLNSIGSALAYSTYLGGSGDDLGWGIAVDTLGSAYVTGDTSSTDFPTTLLAFDTTFNGIIDVFVTKLNTIGSAPLGYSTYLGGSNRDLTRGGLHISVDALGSTYLTGQTFSVDFPTTLGAFDTTHNGSEDAFVTKLNVTGSSLDYSTYLGGSSTDVGFGIAVDSSGSAYVTGITISSDFPTTPGAFDTTHNGSSDAYVTKLNPAGSALAYSTFLGGNNGDSGWGITVNALGSAYVTGFTSSADFPTTPGAFDTTLNGAEDAYLTKLNPAGSALDYSTYLGGANRDFGLGIAGDALGSAYVTGLTQSTDFPTTAGAFDTTFNGTEDAFVTKFSFVGPPATLTLTPPAATNTVGTSHCVTATVQDALGNPTPGITVRFTVTGSVNTSGSATTDSNGEAVFCYMGPPLPGVDTISAYADTDNDNVHDADEPSGGALKTWVPPGTTPLCEITVTNGGWIIAANGDPASFGGIARADGSGLTQGQEEYQDHGPVQPLNMHSINVLAIVCEGSTRASIYGQATINGSGTFFYRINVQDLAEPGRGQDTYGILINGYDSGEQILRAGNVQIRRQ